MKMNELLDRKQIEKNKLQLKDNWEIINNKKIRCRFVFKDFSEVLDFVNKVAEVSIKLNHHPEIFIRYDEVIIEIWTHKIKGLTKLDFKLAEEIESIKI